MPVRRLLVLLGAVLVGLTAFPVTAPAAPGGPSVRGALEGSGSSTLDGVGGHPAIRSVSEGTLRATFLGPGSYRLVVTDVGAGRYVTLTIATRAGTLQAAGGPFIPADLDAPLTINEATGRFARSSGTLALVGYTKTDVVCVPPFPGAPAIFCDWNETAQLSGSIRMH